MVIGSPIESLHIHQDRSVANRVEKAKIINHIHRQQREPTQTHRQKVVFVSVVATYFPSLALLYFPPLSSWRPSCCYAPSPCSHCNSNAHPILDNALHIHLHLCAPRSCAYRGGLCRRGMSALSTITRSVCSDCSHTVPCEYDKALFVGIPINPCHTLTPLQKDPLLAATD